MDEGDKMDLFTLYNDDFCKVVKQEIPFCNYESREQFSREYGQFNETDDNSDYFSKGIMGVVSITSQFITENFDAEIKMRHYEKNYTKIQTLVQSKEFISIFILHFTDTKAGLNRFKDIIIQTSRVTMKDDLDALYLYYVLVGLFLLTLLVLLKVLWIRSTNHQLKLLALSFSLVPVEILNDPQTISLLKKAQED